jgi:hypothetical protein
MFLEAKEQTKKLKARIERLKEGRSCEDCKIDWPPYVMSFDLGDIDTIVTSNVIEERLEQLGTAELVCANCLRIRVHKRNTGG